MNEKDLDKFKVVPGSVSMISVTPKGNLIISETVYIPKEKKKEFR